MGKIRLLTIIIIAIIPAASLAGQAVQEKLLVANNISSKDLMGFEKCKISKNLSVFIDKLYSEERPIKKENEYIIYKVNTEMYGLTVKEIVIGVCDDGSRNCGWGQFLGLIISMPVKDAKILLLKNTGIDFTKENRDEEAGITLRPILKRNIINDNESILYCDPGIL